MIKEFDGSKIIGGTEILLVVPKQKNERRQQERASNIRCLKQELTPKNHHIHRSKKW